MGLHGQAAATMLPALTENAPLSVHRRYRARVMASLNGPVRAFCAGVASVSADPEQHRAGWTVAPVTVALVHAPDCPATFTRQTGCTSTPRRRW